MGVVITVVYIITVVYTFKILLCALHDVMSTYGRLSITYIQPHSTHYMHKIPERF